MPAYEFLCEGCGSFEVWLLLKEAHDAATCPACRSEARRIYTPPALVKTPVSHTRALDRAYKSAYQPEVVKRQRPAEEKRVPTPLVQHGRPWQIGH
jgi:putative FmdB family regulatory protein